VETTAARSAPESGDGAPYAADPAGGSNAPDRAGVPGSPDVVAASAGRRPRDMILSLLVLLIPLALLVGIYRVVHQGDQPVVIDPAPTVAGARDAGFPVAEPAGLGEGWRPVSAVFRSDAEEATLRLGYLTPAGSGVQVVQSTVPVERLLPAELGDSARMEGTVDAGGVPWQRYVAGRLGHALVLLEADRTILVMGNATDAELRALAAALSGTR
jgi:hypothetical protein